MFVVVLGSTISYCTLFVFFVVFGGVTSLWEDDLVDLFVVCLDSFARLISELHARDQKSIYRNMFGYGASGLKHP